MLLAGFRSQSRKVSRGEAHPLKTQQVKLDFSFQTILIVVLLSTVVKISHSIILLDCTSGKY